jgi:hypothetical protein
MHADIDAGFEYLSCVVGERPAVHRRAVEVGEALVPDAHRDILARGQRPK